MQENFYYGAEKIARRLNMPVNKVRKLCKDGVIIAHKERQSKGAWFCNETEIIKTIRERLPKHL